MQNATEQHRPAGIPPDRDRERDGGSTAAARRLRVLVVDDEPLIGTTLRILLDDHEVTVVTSGRSARELLARGEPFDAILCDLMLDDFSGIDLSNWLAAERPELTERVVFMTGGAFTEEARRFLRGIPRRRQLEKPFSSTEILGLLASLE